MIEAAIVGAGPAGLAAAERLSEEGVAATVFEGMPSPGRKFLLAGRGGLNLTHSEPLEAFLARYGAAAWIRRAVAAHPPHAVRAWADGLGEETFVGSSGRVFPRSFKASPILRAWLARLGARGVTIRPRHRFTGFADDGALRFDTPGGPVEVHARATLLALGGASWPRMGSDGAWTRILAAHGVPVAPLAPANCGFEIAWSALFRERFAGAPLKRIALGFGGRRVRGEAVVTADGIEGQAVYALAAELREAIRDRNAALLEVDLRPDLDEAAIAARLAAARPSDSLSNVLRKAVGLSPVAAAILREDAGGPDLQRVPEGLARRIRRLRLRVVAARPLDRAISTAGGVRRDAVTDAFELGALPGVFVAGEMLDWEAPTGGYLLNACFATGRAAADGMLAHLRA